MIKSFALFLMTIIVVSCGTNEEDNNNESTTNHFVNWYKTSYNIRHTEDGTEVYRYKYSFDSQGREIGYEAYSHNILSFKHTNYQYDNLNVTYIAHYCTNGIPSQTTKMKDCYIDDNYIKKSTHIQYTEDGTETLKELYSYDSEGREISHETYYYGKISSKRMNYKYDGLNCTYDEVNYDYNTGVERLQCRVKCTYLDSHYVKMKFYAQYTEDGSETFKSESTYDSAGRKTGTSTYYNKILSSKSQDYNYENETATYKDITYSNGNVESVLNMKDVYHNR